MEVIEGHITAIKQLKMLKPISLYGVERELLGM